jgi:hypothetical protein
VLIDFQVANGLRMFWRTLARNPEHVLAIDSTASY